MVLVALLLLLAASECVSFHTRSKYGRFKLKMTDNEPLSERTRVLTSGAAVGRGLSFLATGAAMVLGKADPANAIGGLTDANNKLANYGLPPIVFVPPGFRPLVSEYGRGNNEKKMVNPILVQFSHPDTWVAQTTSVNNNGESGTVGANDYIKGDSANLFEYKLKSGESPSTSSKNLYQNIIEAALGRKGDVLESVKVLQVDALPPGLKGEKYFRTYFSYSLNTEAGFLIARQGIMSTVEINGFAENIITGTTSKRWKQKMEPILKDIVDSFRAYKLDSGIFSS